MNQTDNDSESGAYIDEIQVWVWGCYNLDTLHDSNICLYYMMHVMKNGILMVKDWVCHDLDLRPIFVTRIQICDTRWHTLNPYLMVGRSPFWSVALVLFLTFVYILCSFFLHSLNPLTKHTTQQNNTCNPCKPFTFTYINGSFIQSSYTLPMCSRILKLI